MSNPSSSRPCLPCPFDGYPAGIKNNSLGSWVECSYCSTQTANYAIPENAVEAWNRRAPVSESAPRQIVQMPSGPVEITGFDTFGGTICPQCGKATRHSDSADQRDLCDGHAPLSASRDSEIDRIIDAYLDKCDTVYPDGSSAEDIERDLRDPIRALLARSSTAPSVQERLASDDSWANRRILYDEVTAVIEELRDARSARRCIAIDDNLIANAREAQKFGMTRVTMSVPVEEILGPSTDRRAEKA